MKSTYEHTFYRQSAPSTPAMRPMRPIAPMNEEIKSGLFGSVVGLAGIGFGVALCIIYSDLVLARLNELEGVNTEGATAMYVIASIVGCAGLGAVGGVIGQNIDKLCCSEPPRHDIQAHAQRMFPQPSRHGSQRVRTDIEITHADFEIRVTTIV